MDDVTDTIICHRCGAEVRSGGGKYWIVRLDAVCDPTPPEVDASEPLDSLAAEYEVLLAQVAGMSERELMDQIHRRMTIHLCSKCFGEWIEF